MRLDDTKTTTTINASTEVYEVIRSLKLRCKFPTLDAVLRYLIMHLEPKTKSEVKEIIDFFKIQGIKLEEDKLEIDTEELTSEFPGKDNDDGTDP